MGAVRWQGGKSQVGKSQVHKSISHAAAGFRAQFSPRRSKTGENWRSAAQRSLFCDKKDEKKYKKFRLGLETEPRM